ncbi:MAG: NlpC/P60 family protein [Patescibacteria group bacterium]
MSNYVSPYHPAVDAARSVTCRAPIGLYDRDARVEDAPAKFSATSLVVWCFARVGIELKDDILELFEAGERIVGSELFGADLIFRTGRHDSYPPDQMRRGLGHVGIYTGEGTVVHASPFIGGVHEDLIELFLDRENGRYRGTRRLIAR